MRRRDPNDPKKNSEIRVPRVLVIDEEGRKLGEFMTVDAIKMAEERALDLIEVAPNASPPVCKISDYGKLKYEKKKREAQAKKRQTHTTTKEVKIRPKTDAHDINVKVRHARRFLSEGNRVRVTLRFRGREFAHRDIGVEKCLMVAKECEDISTVESHPKMEGRQMFMLLAPTKKAMAKAIDSGSADKAESPPAESVVEAAEE